ncbi:MAG TPA: hypothetical protein VEV17_25515 [Bryobacteraceae bacterium]|nr:hypothetical protein [Bryobacteraceae bacterium]
MTKKDSFTYSVAAADFPIAVEVESFDQANNMSVISDGMVTRPADGNIITTFPLSLQPVPGKANVQGCQIPDPSAAATPAAARYPPPADLNLTFVFSFATANGPNPKYEIRLIPTAGAPQVRTVRQPNLRDFVVFEYR